MTQWSLNLEGMVSKFGGDNIETKKMVAIIIVEVITVEEMMII